MTPQSYRARIRMYRVGLGDCFLLTFLNEESKHMLIDCGMFAGSRLDKDKKEKELKLDVVNNIVEETGGTLDVVVITHEHMDHVSIFNTAKSLFENMTFKQAWFGWVEDPKNDDAKRLREKYEGLRMALSEALTGLQGLAGASPGEYKEFHQRVAAVAEFTGLAADGSIAEQPRAAMDFVKDKAGKKNLRFGYPGQIWDFAGTKVYILGPPSAEDQLRKMEKAGGSYDRALALISGAAAEGKRTWYPFSDQWMTKKQGSHQLAGRDSHAEVDHIIALYNEARDEWRRIDNLELDSSSDLALQMDKYINNTSLALAFEFEDGDVMLFPGDAQAGNWDSWFQIKEFDVPDLLKRTVFYKVGHHGSHNATLKGALELMNHPQLVAMIPTNASFARDSKGWIMPAPKLNKALKEHTGNRLLRNDQGVNRVPDPLKNVDWEGLDKRVEVTELYIDYFV